MEGRNERDSQSARVLTATALSFPDGAAPCRCISGAINPGFSMRASCKFKTENEGRHVEWRVGKGLVLGFDFSNVHGQQKGGAHNRG
jgi:hypothetical protein